MKITFHLNEGDDYMSVKISDIIPQSYSKKTISLEDIVKIYYNIPFWHSGYCMDCGKSLSNILDYWENVGYVNNGRQLFRYQVCDDCGDENGELRKQIAMEQKFKNILIKYNLNHIFEKKYNINLDKRIVSACKRYGIFNKYCFDWNFRKNGISAFVTGYMKFMLNNSSCNFLFEKKVINILLKEGFSIDKSDEFNVINLKYNDIK